MFLQSLVINVIRIWKVDIHATLLSGWQPNQLGTYINTAFLQHLVINVIRMSKTYVDTMLQSCRQPNQLGIYINTVSGQQCYNDVDICDVGTMLKSR